MARDYVASLPPAQFPNMIALADEFALSDPDERFDIFIDGPSRRAAPGPRPGDPLADGSRVGPEDRVPPARDP